MACFLAASILFLICNGSKAQEKKEGKSLLTHREIIVGGERLLVEVSFTPDALQRGLQFRNFLPENQGMLFVYESPQILTFWMKDTLIPLDIAFISEDGLVLNIDFMNPDDGMKYYRSAGPARYAIEVNQGWFKNHGVIVGSRVSF